MSVEREKEKTEIKKVKAAAEKKKTADFQEQKAVEIKGNDGRRLSSKLLEERVQRAVRDGARQLHVIADGQHGIGGRIWPREAPVHITVSGPVGQRLGGMGMEGTGIVVRGSVSDDVGWINCGARITVLGDVTNGAHNAAAQGVLYVQGSAGARSDTLTKHNPRFDPPQSWYFRDVGDSFAEFKAGGISVVCGVNPRNPDNILGYRPCVGMVGGVIYFRGPIMGFSATDVRKAGLTDDDWKWLKENLEPFLKAIEREDFYGLLTKEKDQWQKLVSNTPAEKAALVKRKVSVSQFVKDTWEKGVGEGGIFAPYITGDRSVLPYITTGEDRRNKPVWENAKYQAPCAYNCPTHIPTRKRTALIRAGRLQEALEFVLEYSPLPATICGSICPNLCMQNCARGRLIDSPLNINKLGSLSLDIKAPKPASPTGHKVAVIGGGPGGLSAAWQLALKGHEVDLYEAEERLGGKLELCIPRQRLPQEILRKELARFEEIGVKVHLKARVDKEKFNEIAGGHEVVIVACGAHQPRKVRFEGSEHVVSAYDFLRGINTGAPSDLHGADVAVIGAGNVGMDVATSAFACGAASVTAVDIQKPAAFGKEMETAARLGTKLLWPKFTERYDAGTKTLHFKDGSSLKADLLVMAIGETPIVDFLPETVDRDKNGWVRVDEIGQTTDSRVYAIGDATRPGLVTNAIGQGRTAAGIIHAALMHYDAAPEVKDPIPYERIKTVYYEAGASATVPGNQKNPEQDVTADAGRCLSCGSCRDCGMCLNACYWGAISRVEKPDGGFEYAVDDEKCIGCGFCAGICPCGVWEMRENI